MKISPNAVHPTDESFKLKAKIENAVRKEPTHTEITTERPIPEYQGTSQILKPMAFDIETYHDTTLKPEYKEFWSKKGMGNRKDPVKVQEKIDENLSKMALDVRTGMIIMIGFHAGEDGYTQFGKMNETESKILREAWEFMNKKLNEGYKLVSFGGKRFDLPFMMLRSVIRNIEAPLRYSFDTLIHTYQNYKTHYHTDLELLMPGSQAEWAYLIGESTVWENEGGLVGEKFEEGDLDWIAQKNLNDMSNSLELYRRIVKWL